jgi:hypothetical protein
MSKPKTTDYDSPWKDIIERYFPAFLAFFFPALNNAVDWSRGYEFLDKELQKILRQAKLGRRLADKLVKVYLNSGQPAFVYIHIEVQGQYDSKFPERMFVYHYRIFDRYHQQIISVAILTDNHPLWRPQQYGYEAAGCRLELQFPIVKILDYRGKEPELLKSTNPFAWVVLAHLKTLETHNAPKPRLQWKKELFKLLQQTLYSPQEIVDLFWFLDWIMALPNAAQQRFDKFVYQYEEEHNVRFVTSIERTALAKGHQQGLQQGFLQKSREDVVEILITRFKRVSKSLREKIETLSDMSLLSKLLKEAVLVDSVKAFEQLVDQQNPEQSPPTKPRARRLQKVS